jgi:hypothetical protein
MFLAGSGAAVLAFCGETAEWFCEQELAAATTTSSRQIDFQWWSNFIIESSLAGRVLVNDASAAEECPLSLGIVLGRSDKS